MTTSIEPHLSLPTAAPINASFANDDIVSAFKQLFADLFEQHLASALHDVNALGMPHLGTFDLVRRNVNADGLALLPGSSEEDATRYLYRAWRSRDSDGRGLHFLKTYLQMLFPNICELEQMMQSKHQPYPLDLYPASLHSGDPDKYLTSRVEIILDYSTEMTDFTKLMSVFRAILPARIAPLFKFRLLLLLWQESLIESSLLLQKNTSMFANPCGLRISTAKNYLWQLGNDNQYTQLSNDLAQGTPGIIVGQTLIKLNAYYSLSKLKLDASWKLGQLVGGVVIPPPIKLDGTWHVGIKNPYASVVKLTQCKISSAAVLNKTTISTVYPYLNKPGLTLNGAWRVSDRIVSKALITSTALINALQTVTSTLLDNKIIGIDYPYKNRLGKLKLNGFKLRETGVLTASTAKIQVSKTIPALGVYYKLPTLNKLNHGLKLNDSWQVGGGNKRFTLNGAWQIGGRYQAVDSHAVIASTAEMVQPQHVDTTFSEHIALDYPYKTRLGKVVTLNGYQKLNSAWQVGGAVSKKPLGFKLRETGVLVEGTVKVNTAKTIDVIDNYLKLGKTAKLSRLIKLDGSKTLNGRWRLGGSVDNVLLNGSFKIGGAIKHSLSINGTWKLGQRTQLVYSSAVISSTSALSITSTVEASIGVFKGNLFSFISEQGTENYEFISTLSPSVELSELNKIVNNRLLLATPPIGDIFMHKGIVYRPLNADILMSEDHDNVHVVSDSGKYYAQFDASVDLSGLHAEVTYLAAV